jgi:HEAT repeat protein
MLRAAVLLLILGGASAAGDEAGDPLRELLEGLRSDRIDQRDAADRKLFDAGPSALPALRRAARDPDAELARRAAALVRRVEASRLLGPSVFRRLPEAETLLASSRDRDWTRAFRAAAAMPGIRRSALDALAPRALAGALEALENPEDPTGALRRAWCRNTNIDPLEELREVAGLVAEWKLRSAVPVLRPSLRNVDPDIRETALLVLGHLDVPGFQPEFVRALQDESSDCRAAAAIVLGLRGSADAVPALVRVLGDDDNDVWYRSVVALRQLDAPAAINVIERLLARDSCPDRGSLIQTLERLRLGVSPRRAVLYSGSMEDVDLPTVRILLDRQGPEAVARLLPLLKDARRGVRGAALSILRQLRAREAVGSIRALLRDSELDLREEALAALVELGDASLADDLLPLAQDGASELRLRAATALAKLGDLRVLPVLRHFLEVGECGERTAVALGMEELGSPDAVPALVRALDDPEHVVAKAAIHAILKLSPACSFRQIARLLGEMPNLYPQNVSVDPTQRAGILFEAREAIRGSDPFLRKGAMTLVEALDLPEALPDLLPLLQDPDPELRCEAIETITCFNGRETLGAILARIEDDSGKIRAVAARRACDLGSRDEVLPFLNRAIEKTGIDKALVSALARIRTRADVPRFMEALRHPDQDVRDTALRSLAALRDKSALSAILPLLEEQDPELRFAAIRTLDALEAPEAIPAFRHALLDPDGDIRTAAIRALVTLRAPNVAPDLERFLDQEDVGVRRVAAHALGQVGSRSAIPRLREALEDPDFVVRQGAARALGLLGAREALPELLELLRRSEANGDSHDGVVEALATLGAREALPDLLRLLLHQIRAQQDPGAVVEGLRRLDPAAAGAALIRFLDQGVFTPQYIDAALQRLYRHDRDYRGHCYGGPPPTPQRLAIQALIDLGCREAIPTLRRLAREDEESVRGEAIQGLCALSGPDSAAELIPLLSTAPDGAKTAVMARLELLGCRDALPALRPFLRDRNPMLRLSAAVAGAHLGGPEFHPELRPLLDDPLLFVRTGVAGALCRNGDRSGLPLLMQLGSQLESLNALRAPAAWQRLATRPLPGPLRGDVRQVLAAIAKDAGLSLELPEDFDSRERDQQFSPDRFPSVLDLLLHLDDATFVLEKDRLRFLPRGDAWKFWEAWAKDLK